ncbi:GAF domain-containing sensor histidine kinase [Litchfieldia alkalitelluris]|uniref:GAF domain-containing sensor histidine kinase n=1 Tax=Litchfieldia alkalitelluris TaxID=304268 RepID=UPI0014730010|nr:GAF domain-containing sensor histidine kinase [Litchfieldia alkalitelluris]
MNDRNILREISTILHEGQDLNSMLQIVLEKLLKVTGFQTGWVFLVNDLRHQLVAYYNLPDGLSFNDFLPMCKEDCWCLEKCRNGKLRNAVNMIECQRLERAMEENWGSTEGITHHATIPIKAGNETYGLINVSSPYKTHFTTEELEILETIALQVGATCYRMKLYEYEQKKAKYLHAFSQWMANMNELNDNKSLLKHGVQCLARLFPWTGVAITLDHQCEKEGDSQDSSISLKEVVGESRVELIVYGETLEELDEMISKQISYHFALIAEKNRIEQHRTELALMEERNRLARDLHDSVNQLLFSITLISKGLQARADKEEIINPLVEIQALSSEALLEMRKLIWQLRPEGLEQGLLTALKRYGELIKLSVDIELHGILNLSNPIEECLWRVGQEALNNVKKHSMSDDVKIIFTVKDFVKMVISDEGCGFDKNQDDLVSGYGLKTMQERVGKLGGSISINSKKNIGTEITVFLGL